MAVSDPRITIRADDKTKRAFRSVRTSLGNLRKSVFSLQTGIAALVGSAGFGALIGRTLKAQDEIGKLSQRLGISTEALSQYKFAADQTGVSFQTLTMGFQRMTRRISEAAAGGGEAVKALQELNLSAKDLNQLAPDQQFEALADAIMEVKNPADQVRLAMKLFDSEGVALIQTMQGGSEEMRRLREEADRVGVTLSQDQTDAAAKALKAMSRLQGSFNAVANELTVHLAPSITQVTDKLGEALPVMADYAKQITDKVGLGIASLWAWLNPSDITGPTTLAESVDEVRRATEQMNAEIDAAREKVPALREMIQPTIGPADEVEQKRKEKRNKAQETELAELWRFEQEKGRVLQHAILDRSRFEMLSAKNKTKMVIGEAIKQTRGVSGQSRKLFEVNKAAGIANAIINAHEAATKSLSAYSWPLGQIMAGLSYAAGMASVNAIRSASFGGGGGGGGSPGGGGGGPVATPPSDFATAPNTNFQGPQQISITVEGSGQLDRNQAEAIAESLRDLINDGGQVVTI